MDIQKMLKEAKELQKSIEKAQVELGNVDVTGSASGGLVEVSMSGQGEIKDIKIKKEAVDPNDVETLEDLVLSALRDASNKAAQLSKATIQKITGGKGMPPM